MQFSTIDAVATAAIVENRITRVGGCAGTEGPARKSGTTGMRT
jgi:hypothetical protein